ncbi:alpha/beta hydrolase [Pseudenhygromyxa sp. WMMC2535]|uniref:alpha/beta fold hydrolase n=1 Tax=Pseudenhygromyxa sp. WMMC2535 TaxID=2712867 RepID=UPI00155698DD|nr:alpha/beta hydrolase [Pseudenhygromyxa sp. WMMC2535]NVB38511.1 alpha/beta hydrolase [Pseudenhygromyxa sp. WMMC2535]
MVKRRVAKNASLAGIPAGFEEQRVDLGEVTLNYVIGPDAGPPLLLIPGQMESWQGYGLVMPALAERFRVVVPDLRGHGKSTRTPGRYSYEICGADLRAFMAEVIGAPAVVAGLSSGGVLALWLGAWAREQVLAVIAEDPPIFASILPRIREERYMRLLFEVAVETLGGPGPRDLRGYFSRLGMPVEGTRELRMIPPPVVSVILGLYRMNRALRPSRPYDVPLLPFNMRASLKFLSEYDPDFSRATADGSLGEGFDVEATLRGIACPTLLLRASASRDPYWGILGAIDDEDLARVRGLVGDLRVVEIPGRHEIHMTEGGRYVEEVERFMGEVVGG